MGTSGSSKGSHTGTPLVPTWLNEPPTDSLPGDGGTDAPDDVNPNAPDGQGNQPQPTTQPLPEPARFQSARGNFSRFASSGGKNSRALRRAVRDYVRSGTGGSGNAVRRMGASRAAASNALGILRGIQRDGIRETLRRLNLQNLIGRPSQDVFIGLTEVVCRDGGLIDQSIARDAWLETVAELGQLEIQDLDTLNGNQIREVFLSFIAHTIEVMLYREIGVNGFRFAEDLNNIEAFDAQFKSYIERAVRDSFSSDLTALSAMSDNAIKRIVDRTYRETWDLVLSLGDRES